MSVFLVGYRCAGKSSLAALLAERLKKNFCDLDSRIEEKAGSSIGIIVKTKGWDFFRELEGQCLKDVLEEGVFLIATGGGIVLCDENIRLMRENGFVIYLKVLPETVLFRMEEDRKQGKNRPPLTEKILEEEIRQGLFEREPLYKKAAHLEISTDGLFLEDIAREITHRLPKEVF